MTTEMALPWSAVSIEDEIEKASDDINQAVMVGDYMGLEQARRDLLGMMSALKLLLDEIEHAVIETLPEEGAVVDGRNTWVDHGSVTRHYDKARLAHDIIDRQFGGDVPPAASEAVGALLVHFNLPEPRTSRLHEIDLNQWDYLESESRPRPKVKVAE